MVAQAFMRVMWPLCAYGMVLLQACRNGVARQHGTADARTGGLMRLVALLVNMAALILTGLLVQAQAASGPIQSPGRQSLLQLADNHDKHGHRPPTSSQCRTAHTTACTSSGAAIARIAGLAESYIGKRWLRPVHNDLPTGRNPSPPKQPPRARRAGW